MFGAVLLLGGVALIPAFTAIVALVITLATFGKSLGIREWLADTLIRTFEWGTSSGHAKTALVAEDESSEDEDTGPPYPLKKRSSSGDLSIIKRQRSEVIERKMSGARPPTGPLGEHCVKSTVNTITDDTLDFIVAGIESIIEDDVTSRFSAEQLSSWNLLTRTRYSFQFLSWKLTLMWACGFLFRYTVLVPIRMSLFCCALICLMLTTRVVGFVPHKPARRWLNRHALLTSMRIFSRSFSAIIRFHDVENRAKKGGICVANHTSPIDVMILSVDNVYAMIGQKQGGFLGFIQNTLSRSESHIWFERSEANDRKKVVQRMRDHVNDPDKLPIIIFPEGTCINNTGVMMFKKGSFEISSTIYPIAMKYDNRLGDAFWNSSEQSYVEYLWRMLTSWSITCDVWYLPAMTRGESEDSVSFARRVKKAIAQKGGLVDLEWDGMLKRERVSSKMKASKQKAYCDHLARTTSINVTHLPAKDISTVLDYMTKLPEEERNRLLQEMDTLDQMSDVEEVESDVEEEEETEKDLIQKITQFVPVSAQLEAAAE